MTWMGVPASARFLPKVWRRTWGVHSSSLARAPYLASAAWRPRMVSGPRWPCRTSGAFLGCEDAELGQGGAGLGVEGYRSLLAALALADDQRARPLADLDVGPSQGDGLLDPDAGVDQEADQAFVPGAAEAFHGADQGALLLAVEPSGRGLDLAERLGGDDLLGQAGVGRPGEERSQGGQLAVDRAGLELAVVAEVGLPLPQLGGCQRPAGRAAPGRWSGTRR